MNACMRFVMWGAMPLGAVAGGVLGDLVGLRAALWVGMSGPILASLWLVLSPVRGLRSVPGR